MTTITQPSLDQLFRMLSAAEQQPRETEFGELLIKIIKKPYIPTTKELLLHPSPTPNKAGQPNRLKKSKLTNHAYSETREKWNKIIAERNLYPDSHGLSYDLFMKMLRDLYGCDDVRDPEMPITREAVNHLVHTGNPWIKSKAAATVQDYNLQFLSCFTQEYTFQELKAVGEKVLEEYQEYKRADKRPVKLRFNLPDAVPIDREENDLYISHEGKITHESEGANNLRALVFNKMIEKGTRYFMSSNLPLEEVVSIMVDKNPSFSRETLMYLPDLLEISLAEFVELLAKDKEELDVGF